MGALIMRGGSHYAKSCDPNDIELWIDNEWRATWNAPDGGFPWAAGEQMFNNILDEVYEAGKEARSEEVLALIGGRS